MRTPIETEAFGDESKQAIFMVSGWAMPKEVMANFARRLSERFYVVVANLPGISLDEQWISRTRIGPNYDIDALTEQLIDVAPKEAWWLGWSLGGMISTYVAARRSSCVKGLITVSSSPSFVQRDSWSDAMPCVDFDGFASLVDQQPEQGLKRFVMLQAKGAQNERQLVKQLQSLLPVVTLNQAALIGGLRMLKSLDVRRELSLLDRPNLHIFGGKDALVSAQCLEQQTDVNPLQETLIMPNCAHQAFLEEEEACVQTVENFIDANNS
ncbi:alpha/beta fold hydrolase [Marinomonas posidonica]|uniref:alpha/beta fold hydrolase n=1 Tax=Marinomonas posidonica TaxID=936476 RepID=UPI003735CFBF